MNKSVVKKLVKAKLLEYEALKEVAIQYLPDLVQEKAKVIEHEMIDIAKEIMWEQMMDRNSSSSDYKEDKKNARSSAVDENEQNDAKHKQGKISKVKIQFGEE